MLEDFLYLGMGISFLLFILLFMLKIDRMIEYNAVNIFNNYDARDLREYLHVEEILSKRSLLRELIFSKDLTLVRGMLMPLENNFKGFIKLSICLFR